MRREVLLNGLDCAHCAGKIEERIQKLEGIKEAHLDFMSKKLTYVTEAKEDIVFDVIVAIIKDLEPGVDVIEKGETHQVLFKGLDCAGCAQKIEDKIKDVDGVQSVSVQFMNTTCTYSCQDKDKKRIDQEIRRIVFELEPDVVIEEISGKKEDAKDFKKAVARIFVGAGLLVAGFLFEETSSFGIVLVLLSYVILGYDIVFRALRNIAKGQWFDENFLMSLATIVAILLKDYREAVAVMLFYQIGEYFQEKAVYSSRKSIADLMDIRPDVAHVQRSGVSVDVRPEEVQVDEIVLVKPGERVPLDGVVVSGASSLDTSSLTGESAEREVYVGDDVLSGCVNRQGLLELRVSKPYAESTVSKILELVENTSSRKTKSENFITKFSKVYTPIIVVLAVLLAVFLPMVVPSVSYTDSIQRACAFLVISCPCALVISIPLGFFAGIGGLSKNGILVKGSTVIEGLSQLNQMVFDKTGTITQGKFGVSKVLGDESTLELAAYAESNSTHPIAKSIVEAFGKTVDDSRIQDVMEIAGHGLQVKVDQQIILVGNQKLMSDHHIEVPLLNEVGTLVLVARNGTYMGTLVIEDRIKQDSKVAIQQLKQGGIEDVSMVTGDRMAVANSVAKEVGVDHVYAECLPQDKVDVVEKLMENGKLGFAGDGINDAPVLALADIGFAMGGLGSDAAIEASDVVVMDDHLSKIPFAIQRSKKTMRIVTQNIVGALGIKVVVLILGAFGFVNMWLAIFADVGVSMIAILNSIRLLKK